MPKKRTLTPNSIWDTAALEAAFNAEGIKTIHIPRLQRYLLRNPGASWDDLPNLPRDAAALLRAQFAVFTTSLVHADTSSDGNTVKLLVRLQDGLEVESVVIPYNTTAERPEGVTTGQQRHTLCVSSEVGCQMGCTFCATGTMGLTADLTAGEILEQLVHASAIKPIRNVVFMGMGEPLNNYDAVRAAASGMTDSRVFGLRRSCVTVSTVGVIPRMIQMATDLPGVSLALSLHAPNQELRARIVPSAKAYRLDRLMAALATYQETSGQRVLIQYVLLGPDVNCTEAHAHELGQLLAGKDVMVNLIPWNPILSPGGEFAAPLPGAVDAFMVALKSYGLAATVRQEKGQDISGACGQLVLERGGVDASGGGGGRAVGDLEDLLLPPTPGGLRGAAAAGCRRQAPAAAPAAV